MEAEKYEYHKKKKKVTCFVRSSIHNAPPPNTYLKQKTGIIQNSLDFSIPYPFLIFVVPLLTKHAYM